MRLISFVLLSTVAVLAACSRSAVTTATPSASPPVASSQLALPEGVSTAMVSKGESVFKTTSCYRCHGSDARGTNRAPDLTDQEWIHIDGSLSAIARLVTTGFTKAEMRSTRYQFAMNPRGGMNLTDEDIAAVSAYVWTLSRKAK